MHALIVSGFAVAAVACAATARMLSGTDERMARREWAFVAAPAAVSGAVVAWLG